MVLRKGLRVAAKPAIARSPANMMSAHSQSVGTGMTGGGAAGKLIVSAFDVTVALDARTLPCKSTLFPNVIPASSMMVPTIEEFAPNVVAATGAQKTFPAAAPLVKLKVEPAPVVRLVPDRKI